MHQDAIRRRFPAMAGQGGGWCRRPVGPHGHNWRSLNARLLLRSGPRRHEVRDENKYQQTVDDDADNSRRKDAFAAVPGNAEQGDDAKNQTDNDQRQRHKI